MIDFRNLRTPQQFAAECPAFTLKQIYGMIYRAEEIGLSPAIRKIGRRWTIDVVKFGEWWEGSTAAEVGTIVPGERQQAQAETTPKKRTRDNLVDLRRRWGLEA